MRASQSLLALVALATVGAGAVAERRCERTFAMVKPDASDRVHEILGIAEREGFRCVANRTHHLTAAEAKLFYREHARRPFFPDLVNFMTSGPVVVLVLERPDAITEWRALIGPTNSEKARESARHTLRAHFGTDGQRNAVHGSDSPSSARREIDFFFGSRARVPIHLRLVIDKFCALLGLLHLGSADRRLHR